MYDTRNSLHHLTFKKQKQTCMGYETDSRTKVHVFSTLNLQLMLCNNEIPFPDLN